jgi:hypothetical protein
VTWTELGVAEAHLNGSVNLASAEDVFRTVSEIAGDTVRRIPDGEIGPERQHWISTVVPALRATPQLVEVERHDPYVPTPFVFRVREGVSSDEIAIPRLPYADNANASFELFRRLRDEEGVIAPGTRFLVALPTPLAVVVPFLDSGHQRVFEPAYARRLRLDVDEMCAAIPHSDLALQWDVAVEFAILEGLPSFPSQLTEPFEEMTDRLCELSEWVPADVELGYHLCYGDAPDAARDGQGRHFKEPDDMANLVAVANALLAGAKRPIDWLSMPVPIARDDDAYFKPLRNLNADGTRVYLGLVHYQDGVEGTQRRIETAKRHWSDFGVCTECGMGRRPREAIPTLLRIQRDAVV